MLKKSKSRGRIYKLLHVFSMGVLIINMSMLGVFFVGHNASADGGIYELKICKYNDPDGDGNMTNSFAIIDNPWVYDIKYPDSTVVASSTEGGNGCVVISPAEPGVYTITEHAQADWTLTGFGGNISSSSVENSWASVEIPDTPLEENNATYIAYFFNHEDSVSEPEICDDGVDNDCDGDIDCNDSDCSGECGQTCEEGDVVPVEGYLDYVDIGSSTSETGHSLTKWSDVWVKPGWGGNYGGGSSDESFRLLMGHGDGCGTEYEDASLTLDAGDDYADSITFEHLDGSVDDSFDVYINDLKVGHYTGGQNPSETWVESTYKFAPTKGIITVKFFATEPDNEWCAEWGQVAFSWVGLKGYACEVEECNYSISGNKHNPLALMDMPGWTINLADASGTSIMSTTTDENGYYSFNNLCAGDYIVSEEIPFGWMQTEPINSLGHDYFEVSLGNSDLFKMAFIEFPTYDFYNKPMICGHKYDSGNDNAPIEGWEINLAQTTDVSCIGEGDNQQCMSAIQWIASTTTNADGEYCFEINGDSEGLYVVSEDTSQPNWHVSGNSSETVEFDGTEPVFVDFYNYMEAPYCGDGHLDPGEECEDGYSCCEGTCVDCQCVTDSHGDEHYCGDGTCDEGEDCGECAEDCGECSGQTYFTYTNQGSNATTPSQSTPSVKGEEGAPNLSISKAVARETANAGDKNISYKIVVVNNGNLTAFNVIVKDTLPAGMTYASDGSTSKTWEIGDLEPGKSKDILYLTNIGEDVDPVVLTNTATVSASNFGEVSDSAQVEVKEIKVLAETGFSLSEFILLILALFASIGSAVYLKKKYLKA